MPMLKQPSQKYAAFKPVPLTDRTWPNQTITRPPVWLATDLRDGNQALIEPMDVERKKKMFALNTKVGIKEVEVGFPSASQTDFDFVRYLIEQKQIPDDVWIQVLSPSREAFIERTFEALKGAKRAIFHLYHAVAPVMRNVVFGMTQDQIVNELTIPHVRQVREMMKRYPETEWRFEFSPEMFSNTELEFSKRVVDTVVEVFGATPQNPIIINLPTTVENATPNCFADQIEWMSRRLARRDSIVLSIHPHNDRGCAVAAAELAVMGDATLLGELARNLVDNAFKYTPRGGSVVLAVLGEPSRIVVDDSGPGVAEADRERVFAPFSRVAQLDTESGTPIPGTGLGLAIVREEAQAHGATVGIETSSMNGARFVVSFASVERQSTVSPAL